MTKKEKEDLMFEMLDDEEENIDEQKLFELYMDYIENDAEEPDDIARLTYVYIPTKLTEWEDKYGRCHSEEAYLYKKVEIEDFFIDEHRRDLKDTIIWIFDSWAGEYD